MSSERVNRHPRTLSVTGLALALGLGFGLAGCVDPGAANGSGVPATTAASSLQTAVALPETALGEQTGWVISAVNGEVEGEALTTGITSRFAQPVLDQLGADGLSDVFAQLGAQGPWVPTAVQDGGTQAVVTITSPGGDSLDLQIALDTDEKIAGLLFTPSAADRTPATSWSELEDAVDGFATDTRLVVAEVEPGGAAQPATTPLLAAGPDAAEAMPSGSMFKLYVLGAVADAVTAGTLAWDQPLTITDDVKSLPSGELQNAPSGSTVTVREAADKMISISDNTATDLLIAAVGPEAVQQQFSVMGQSDPARNVPLLTTRALFQLGWGTGESEAAGRAAWADADSAGRQAILSTLPTGLVDVAVQDVATPVWQSGLDWFTTADDLTAAHLALQQKAQDPAAAPVRDILAINNGLGETFGDAWSYVAFKGGSSIGVLGGSWYLERADGRAFTVSIQGESADPAALADQATFFGQVQDAVALLEKE
ncbi:serine hydrolase [Herbiconiux sp. YIM B11900]|uniref:serine hydrolase n=1 Tax=Herbiconiux sp. YIM B11900 TaxID=3404131 RepID=UPI003F853B0F